MGVLDSKTRTLDTIVTLEGRKQISSGKLKVEYVSFTDSATYYRGDVISGSADATVRLYLESCNLPQDSISLESDDSGHLKPFNNSQGVTVKDGQILQYTFDKSLSSALTGSNQGVSFMKGDAFASQSESLLASSIDNFKKLRIISSKDALFEDDGFAISNKSIEFMIHDERPLPDARTHVARHEHLESLFNDPRFSRVKNFKYLPPLNKIKESSVDKKDHRQTSKSQLGNYRPWGRTHHDGLTGSQLELELSHYEKLGYSKTVSFEPTSRDNRLLAQFFEVNYNTMKKLDVVDFGSYSHRGSLRRAFFVGKVMTNAYGSNTFVHLFTLVFG